MKIDEPKTPYEYDEAEEEDREMTEDVEPALEKPKEKEEMSVEEKEVMASLKLA